MRFLFYMLIIFFVSNSFADERDYPKLDFNTIDKLSVEDLDFKEAKLSNEQFKFLTGKARQEAAGLRIRIYAPQMPFFLTTPPEDYYDLSTPLKASMSKRIYYTKKLLELDKEYLKTDGQTIKDKLKSLREKQNYIPQANNQGIVDRGKKIAELEKKKEKVTGEAYLNHKKHHRFPVLTKYCSVHKK